MRCLVVYSSRTGNTKKVAKAIFSILPATSVLSPVEQAPDPDPFDFICLGFWVDRGKPDAAMAEYMKRVQQKQVGLFGTLGAWPHSQHAHDCMEHAKALMAGNEVLGTFICQGKIDPKLLAAMETMREAKQAHLMTEDRKARIEEAKKHPNANDCAQAKACFTDMLQKLAWWKD